MRSINNGHKKKKNVVAYHHEERVSSQHDDGEWARVRALYRQPLLLCSWRVKERKKENTEYTHHVRTLLCCIAVLLWYTLSNIQNTDFNTDWSTQGASEKRP